MSLSVIMRLLSGTTGHSSLRGSVLHVPSEARFYIPDLWRAARVLKSTSVASSMEPAVERRDVIGAHFGRWRTPHGYDSRWQREAKSTMRMIARCSTQESLQRPSRWCSGAAADLSRPDHGSPASMP